MTDTNHSMDASQKYVPLDASDPLDESDAVTLASGFYELDTEVVEVTGRLHKSIVYGQTGPVVTVLGRECTRAAVGTTAATHTTAKTLKPAVGIDTYHGLPSSDPLVAGAPYIDTHTVKISTGS